MPHVCKSLGDPCLNNIRKVWTISCRMSSIASKSDIPGALWLNFSFEKSFEKNQKFFEKCWKFENFRKYLIFFKTFFETQIEPQGARNVRFWRYSAHSTGNCPYFSNIIQTWVPQLFAHMWHTKGTLCEKIDFCACCVLIIMCLVSAHTWGCAPP